MQSIFFVGLLVFLVGCGDGQFSSPSGTISATQAATLASLSGSTSPQAAITVNNGSAPGDLPTGLGRAGFADCTTYDPASGEETDADSDGIPLTQKTTWACTDITDDRSTTFSRNGTRTITDKNDTSGSTGGYRWEYDITGSSSSTSNDTRNTSSSYSYVGFFDLTSTSSRGGRAAGLALDPSSSRAGSWSYSTDWKGESTTNSSSGTSSTLWGHTFEYEMTQTSTSTSNDTRENSGGSGTAAFEGYYAYKNTGDDRSSGGGIDVVFRFIGKDLEWQYGCTYFYKAGSITWIDGGGNRMVWTFNSCESRTVTFNGRSVTDT